jgi:hypothetical protein
MRLPNHLVLGSCLLSFVAHGPIARASDPRCNAPPYGSTVLKFQAFVKHFGHLVTPTRMLPELCNAKYGGGSRTGLYNLGFTDRHIDTTDTSDLAVDVIEALRNLSTKSR